MRKLNLFVVKPRLGPVVRVVCLTYREAIDMTIEYLSSQDPVSLIKQESDILGIEVKGEVILR